MSVTHRIAKTEGKSHVLQQLQNTEQRMKQLYCFSVGWSSGALRQLTNKRGGGEANYNETTQNHTMYAS
uniref:Uncharacterized protein n=1 Tax=Arundo donax TaxID=35708 RepID=A0A0A9E6Z0_ARUDO